VLDDTESSGRSVIELPPIVAARQLIGTQRRELHRELQRSAPRANVVQMALQGSLLLQVYMCVCV
jgi:hypothetical protein